MGTRVFAFTYAGKPLFTNCPEGEQSLAFYGVLCAVASKVSTLLSEYTSKDELRYISAGDEHFVYLDRGPLCYFGIGPKGESPLMVYKVLSYLHLQILSILTRGVERVLLKRPSYDVQNLLGGTQSILQNLVTSMDSPLSLLDTRGYEALPLPADTRSKLSSFFTDFKSPNVL
ncbi:Trafficking protein Mon1, putative [Babesia bigemina]|uniref:Trafficking protein Mon1, putative n=1 Tax=Babesia bigemina TaxID=5866 RepID=A0A061DD40_BABBI|nr:Trafficking protein Mon1, putative [Babesia bigemina]CDR97079.1 Trafficking protein Mon1, putative [Babesia bigemina]|eukprot:XP_012769265.1 Trafficking protein Mon1, putative [Babesia bigemina]